MDIKIVDNTALKLHVAYGMTEERANEISDNLDSVGENIILGHYKTPAQIYQAVAAHCNTPEELIYAVINHYHWLVLKGFIALK